MFDALLAGVIMDEAGALVRDFDTRTLGCRCRRAATGGTAYRLHRKMETRHRRALASHAGAWRGRQPAGVQGYPLTHANASLHKCALPLFRSEEHTSELQSLMRHSSAVLCLKKTKKSQNNSRKNMTSHN